MVGYGTEAQPASLASRTAETVGDRVVIVGENSRALAALILGASEIHTWSVVVNPRLSAREIDLNLWFLPVYRYNTPAQLLSELSDRVINPSEAKALEFHRAPER